MRIQFGSCNVWRLHRDKDEQCWDSQSKKMTEERQGSIPSLLEVLVTSKLTVYNSHICFKQQEKKNVHVSASIFSLGELIRKRNIINKSDSDKDKDKQ